MMGKAVLGRMELNQNTKLCDFGNKPWISLQNISHMMRMNRSNG